MRRCVPPPGVRPGVWSRGRLARAYLSLWVGLVLRLVCEVLVSVSCVSSRDTHEDTGGSRDTHERGSSEGKERGREPDGFYKYVIRFCLV